jgi:heat shock protein beta-11
MDLIELGSANLVATSSDGEHHIGLLLQKSATSDGSSFFMSTGLFPQEIIISLAEPANIKSIELSGRGIKVIELGKIDSPQTSNWDAVASSSLEDDGNIQRIVLEAKTRNTFIASSVRLRIVSGWDSFVSIHKISVIGSPVTTLIDGSPAVARRK